MIAASMAVRSLLVVRRARAVDEKSMMETVEDVLAERSSWSTMEVAKPRTALSSPIIEPERSRTSERSTEKAQPGLRGGRGGEGGAGGENGGCGGHVGGSGG